MKTPRELLLERHRAQSAALDQIRKRVIAHEFGESPALVRQEPRRPLFAAFGAWLTFPRAAWGGFAAVWCVILGLNLAAEREMETSVAARAPTDSEQFLAGLLENRAQLAALLFDQENGGAREQSSREPKPGPRSNADHSRKDASLFHTAFV